jgi:hypothetical protein
METNKVFFLQQKKEIVKQKNLMAELDSVSGLKEQFQICFTENCSFVGETFVNFGVRKKTYI